jgi:hypothetical protein
MYVGTVVSAADPQGLGRVRVTIPGLLEGQSGWCFPMGMPGGGGKGVGMKMVPRANAEVCVFFKGGDPDCPYYMPAQWGAPGGASEVPIAGENFPTSTTGAGPGDTPEIVDVIETEQYIITIDNRPATKSLRFKDKVSGDMIEMDGTAKTGPGISIYGTAAVYIKSDGAVVIDALSCTINGRVVSDGPQGI